MSSSLLSSPTLHHPLATASAAAHRRKMATCVHNCRTKTAIHKIDGPLDDPIYQYIHCNGLSDLILRSDCTTAAASGEDPIWAKIKEEARSDINDEPILRSYYTDLVLSHTTLDTALSRYLAAKLSLPDLIPPSSLYDLFHGVISEDSSIRRAVRADLRAARDRDPACSKMLHCFLHYKGFLAIQAHRIAHRLWASGRLSAALLIQGRASEVFAVDIHPGARIGSGVLLDHATGVVVGETAVVGDDVSILHGVTLGGTGKEAGDRHPKIGDGVLIGAGAQILGSVGVGAGAKVGAGSVVLKSVPPRTTAVGNPARLVGGKENPVRLRGVAGLTMDHTSWSDYVI